MKMKNSIVLSRKKGSSSKGAVVFLLIVVLLIAGGFFFRDYIVNQFRLLTMKPDKYFAWVYEKNASAAAKGISAGGEIAEEKEKNNTPQAVQVTANLEAGEDLSAILQEALHVGADDAFGFLAGQAGETLDKIETVEVSALVNSDSHAQDANIDFSLNDRHVINIETLTDIDNQLMYYRFPKLSERWILPDSTYGSMAEYGSVIQNNPAEYFTPETLSEMIPRYTETAVSEIGGVEIEKRSPVDIGSMTVKYTAMSAEIDSNTAYDLLIALLEEVKADETINEAVNGMKATSSEDFRANIQQTIDSLTQKKTRQENTFLCNYTTYVNGKGDICGISIESKDSTLFEAVFGQKLRQIGGTVSAKSGSDGIDLTLEAKAGSDGINGTLSGTVTANGTSHELEIGIEGLRTSTLKKGEADGSITVKFDGKQLTEITFTADENGGTIKMPVNLADKSLGTLTLTLERTEATEITVPDRAAAYTPDGKFSVKDIPQIAEKEDYIAFCTELLTGFGMEESKAKTTAEASAKLLYVSSALDIAGKLQDLLPF